MERASDLALVRRFKKGDEQAFNRLVRRYQDRVYRLCYRMLRNHDDAADLVQDVFVKAYLSLPRFREKSSFYTWIYRIAMNLCVNFAKRHPGWEKATSEPHSSNPEEEMTKSQVRRTIDDAVKKLPPKQKAAFVMRQYEGMSYEDMAKVANRSVGTLKANYHHAVLKLRDLLKEYRG